MSTYKIKSGDTLWALSRKFGTTVKALDQQHHRNHHPRHQYSRHPDALGRTDPSSGRTRPDRHQRGHRYGSVKCWGANFNGMLGDGTTISRNVPTDVVGLTSGIAAISAASSATCALTSAGAVKCWGNNRDGQLADGTYVDKLTPNSSALSGGVTALSAGSRQSCAHPCRNPHNLLASLAEGQSR